MKRRVFLIVSVIAIVSALSASCAAPTPQVITQQVEKVVTKEVEKVVTQQVEKVVTQQVEKVVQVVVTPTPAPKGKPRSGGTLVYALDALPTALNPWSFSGGNWKRTLDPLYSGRLCWVLPDETLTPYLASSWEVSADSTVFTFRLVKNALWHDGKPFTAADVVYSLSVPLFPVMASSFAPAGVAIVGAKEYVDGTAKSVSGIKAVDDYTVQITLMKPSGSFLYDVCLRGALAPKHIFEGIAPADIAKSRYVLDQVIGIGPFKLSKVVKDEYWEFVKNDKFFMEGPYIDKIVVKQLPSAAALVAALKAGEADLVSIQPVDIGMVQASSFLNLYPSPKRSLQALWMDMRNPVLQDIRIRQAIAHAIDVQALIDGPLAGFGKPWPHTFVPTWSVDPSVRTFSYDPALSRKLLADAGYPNGLKLEPMVSYVATDDLSAVQAMLKAVGIDAPVQVMDSPAWLKVVHAEPGPKGGIDWDLAYGSGFGGDPGALINWFTVAQGETNNVSKWTAPKEVLAAMDAGFVIADQAKRAESYKLIDRIVNQEIPYVPLFRPYDLMGVNARVANFDWDKIYWVHPNTWYLYGD